MSRLLRSALLFATLTAPAAVRAQATADPDSPAIIATARDYIDGFWSGDTARMRGALHPDLAKRQVLGGRKAPVNMTADMLVGTTARMAGRPAPAPTAADSIVVLHRDGDMALVRIGAPTWVDYLQLARFEDRWQIVNVLWQMRARG